MLKPMAPFGPLREPFGLNMSSQVIPNWSQGSQMIPGSQHAAPGRISSYIPAGYHPGYTGGPHGSRWSYPYSLYIYTLAPGLATREINLNLYRPSFRPVKMRSKSMSPSPLCGHLADSEIDPRKIHAVGAHGPFRASSGALWAQHVIPGGP